MRKILFLLLFVLPAVAYSQFSSQGKVFSLDACIELAMQNNTDLQLAKAAIGPTQASVTSAFGNFLPSANFSAGYSRQLNENGGRTINIGGQTIPVPPTDPNSYSMNASVSYLIFDGFSRGANYKISKANLNSDYMNFQFVEQSIKTQIYAQYVNVIRIDKIVKIRKEALQTANKEMERIDAQYQAGIIAVDLVYAQQVEVTNREIDVINAESDLKEAKFSLLTIMGLNPDTDAEFLDSSLPNELEPEDIARFRRDFGNYAAAVKKALENRFDIKATEYDIEAANSSLVVAESGYFPTLAASGGWSWSNSELADFSDLGRSYAGLSIRVPIFDNFNTNYQIENAKLAVKQSKIRQIQLEREIRSAIQSSLNNLDRAEKQLEVTNRAMVSANANFESSKERFHVGTANIIEYFTANSQLISAQINRVNAMYNYYLAQKSLLFEIGEI